MYITDRQKHLIANLDEITSRKKASGNLGYFLNHEDCSSTINSLIVKGLVRMSADQKRLHWTGAVPRQI